MSDQILNCKFSFKCPKKWELMAETADPTVRSCTSCNRDVHLATTQGQLDDYIERNLCIAVVDFRGYATAGAVAIDSHSQYATVFLKSVPRLTVMQIRALAPYLPGVNAMNIKARYEGQSSDVLLLECLESEAASVCQRLAQCGLDSVTHRP